jgi:hypothetical protein
MSYLRNNGLVSEWEYKGKTLEEATQYAKQGGFDVRVVEVDGQAKMLDMSVSSSRVNFRVKGDVVTAVYTG